MFDITVGSYSGAETCKLTGLSILDTLTTKTRNTNVSLYREDELALLKHVSSRLILKNHFNHYGLSISIKSNLKIVDFWTSCWIKQTYYPYRKPNNEHLYIKFKSNCTISIIKHIPDLNLRTKLNRAHGGSVSWASGCYAVGHEFNSGRTNTQGLKITE